MRGLSRFTKVIAILTLIGAILVAGFGALMYFIHQIIPQETITQAAESNGYTYEQALEEFHKWAITFFLIGGGVLLVSILSFVISGICKHKYNAKQQKQREELQRREMMAQKGLSEFKREYHSQFQDAARTLVNHYKQEAPTMRCVIDYKTNDDLERPIKVVFTFSVYGDNDDDYVSSKNRKTIEDDLGMLTSGCPYHEVRTYRHRDLHKQTQ